jgi:hypothetical protein
VVVFSFYILKKSEFLHYKKGKAGAVFKISVPHYFILVKLLYPFLYYLFKHTKKQFMPRKKLERVKDLDIAKTRLAAITSISPTLDLGNGITAVNYKTLIDKSLTSLALYNTTLSSIDELYNKCLADIDKVKDYSDRVLSGVASKYSRESNEYEMAGGTKKSERKKAVKKVASKTQ